MEAKQSAFAAYNKAPAKYFESKKSPKKNKSKTNGLAGTSSSKKNIPNGSKATKRNRSVVEEEMPATDTPIAPKEKNGQQSALKKQKTKAKQNQNRIDEVLEVSTTSNRRLNTPITINANIEESQRSQLNDDIVSDSIEKGKIEFTRIIAPLALDKFMSDHWEKIPLHINREHFREHYKKLVSTDAIDEMLRSNFIEYTKNIDVTSYVDGVRETHNPEGRALPSSVWDFYRDGCSIRLLNPQTYIPSIRKLNATLQEYFHCMVGANVYLTPPNSQGFAPHYDDIEAFVLQVEGEKMWRLYRSRDTSEILPRVSSGNFSADELGAPIMEITLKAGDLLYFPRGMIHEARTVPGSHSLHITLSVYQKTSFADLLEILLPQALQRAAQTEVDLRRGLPLNIWHEFGLVHRESSAARQTIGAHVKKLFERIVAHVDLDSAVDQMALKYQHDALPPEIEKGEKSRTIYGVKSQLNADGQMEEFKIDEDTELRLLRANIIRLVSHDDSLRIYFYADNSKEYHEYDMNYVEVEATFQPVIEHLIKSYPNYVRMKDFPLTLDENFTIIYELWGRGLLITRDSLN